MKETDPTEMAVSRLLGALGDRDRWLLIYANASRTLNEGILTQARRVLGEDHPNTPIWAGVLADLYALGDYQQVGTLDEDTFTRARRILGEDDPRTLILANNLARDLRALGDYR